MTAPKKPNSDRSRRALGRKATRELAQAENKAQQTLKEVGGPPAGGFRVDIQELLAHIGALTLERDFYQRRAAALESELAALNPADPPEDETPEETLAKEGPPTGKAVE